MEDMVRAEMTGLNPGFWHGKRVLLTGHTGFKGAWLTQWLHQLGAEVTGLSLPPDTNPNLFTLAKVEELCDSHYCDIRDPIATMSLIKATQPEIVFHLAAQPLVRASYKEPIETFATNVMGTVHVLEALRGLDSVRAAVMVTTDKVYRNHESPRPFHEDDALGGHDPYSASKAGSELVIASYRDSFLTDQGVSVASARAGNVIGGGDWAQDRLIPDAIRAWQAGQPLSVRSPRAVRPWQHVLEPLSAYLIMAQNLWERDSLAGSYNVGPESHSAATVQEVLELARSAYGAGELVFGDDTEGLHEAGWLSLDVAKARESLGIEPHWSLADAVNRTMAWYREQHAGQNARTLCQADISDYEALL
jgi:CDP-glucose 4,6-dehydratase